QGVVAGRPSGISTGISNTNRLWSAPAGCSGYKLQLLTRPLLIDRVDGAVTRAESESILLHVSAGGSNGNLRPPSAAAPDPTRGKRYERETPVVPRCCKKRLLLPCRIILTV